MRPPMRLRASKIVTPSPASPSAAAPARPAAPAPTIITSVFLDMARGGPYARRRLQSKPVRLGLLSCFSCSSGLDCRHPARLLSSLCGSGLRLSRQRFLAHRATGLALQCSLRCPGTSGRDFSPGLLPGLLVFHRLLA